MNNNPYIIDVTRETFSRVVLEGSRQVPVLVDFWAAWCGPCKSLVPVLEGLAREYDGKFILAKINSDEQQELAAQYGVRSLPTVKVFRNGSIVDEFMGAQPESVIREILDRHIEKPADKIRLQAEEAMQNGENEKALALLLQAHELAPDDANVKLEIAALQLQLGNVTEAKRLLDELPLDLQHEDSAKGLRAQIEQAQLLDDAPAADQLEQLVAQDPDNLKARQQLAAHCSNTGNYEAALEQFYEILRRDRNFGDDAGRRGMIGVFEILGNQGDLVRQYRRKMSSLLF